VTADAAALARNMSAPPRTILKFTALARQAGATGDAVADGTGLAFVCRLDLRALLPASRQGQFPGFFASAAPAQMHRRIRWAHVYAQAEAAGRRRAQPGALAQSKAAPIEAVADRLRDLLAVEPLAAAGLPQVGLLLPAEAGERTVLRHLVRTLAILARRRGSLFLRDADPIVWSAVDGEPLDLWTTVAAGRCA